jgi:hypothetical protein
MNRFYAHAEAGEPTARLNDRDPADPFVVVYFGTDWDFTSKDPHWCHRVAATWTQAAELLEQATERDRNRVDVDEVGVCGACAASIARDPGSFVRCEEGNPS